MTNPQVERVMAAAADFAKAMTRSDIESKATALRAAVEALAADNEALKDALWKACGDDEQMVNDYIEGARKP